MLSKLQLQSFSSIIADFVTRDKLEIRRLLKQVWNPKQANSKKKLSIPTSSINLFSLSYTNCSVNGKNTFQVLTLKKQKEFSPLPSFASRLPSPGPSLGPALPSHARSGKCTWEWGRDLASRSETQHWKYTALCCMGWPWAGSSCSGWCRQLWLAAQLIFRGCCCSTHLEPSVIFSYSVCKIDLLPLAHKLAELGAVLHAYVISHKVPVNAVPSSLLLVQQQIWCLNTKHKHWLTVSTKFCKVMLSKSQLFHTEFLRSW